VKLDDINGTLSPATRKIHKYLMALENEWESALQQFPCAFTKDSWNINWIYGIYMCSRRFSFIPRAS
jgi:hypothetical protein